MSRIALNTYPALGDMLLLSAVAHALVEQGNPPPYVITPYPELFIGNPDIKVAKGISSRLGRKAIDLLRYKRVRAMVRKLTGERYKFVHYSVKTETPGICQSPKEHIISTMCRQAGIRGEVELRPRYYGALPGPQQGSIVVQSTISNARFPIITKEWGSDRMQEVVDHLASRYPVVQVGLASDPPLKNVKDLRGKLSIPEVADLLTQSRLFVGMVGFLMHLARAVDCPGVIIYGGREAPWQTGYSCNTNLYRQLDCAPCWRETGCPYDMQCMREITPTDVLTAIYQRLELKLEREILPAERITIS